MSATAKDFRSAAEMVRAILHNGWTLDTPSWAGPTLHTLDLYASEADEETADLSLNYTRAVWSAELLILFFQQSNPRFNPTRFLVACGLLSKENGK